jgi:hypothetical protein
MAARRRFKRGQALVHLAGLGMVGCSSLSGSDRPMPHKHNADRRHHIPKMSFRVRNWPAYEAGLRRRGSLTLWIEDAALECWQTIGPSGQARYTGAAIQTSLMLRAAFKLPLRQIEGLMTSVLSLMGLTISTPDHTTVSRRAVTLPVIQATSVPHGPLHVLIDSTGLQVYGAGQWLEAKHGAKLRLPRQMMRPLAAEDLAMSPSKGQHQLAPVRKTSACSLPSAADLLRHLETVLQHRQVFLSQSLQRLQQPLHRALCGRSRYRLIATPCRRIVDDDHTGHLGRRHGGGCFPFRHDVERYQGVADQIEGSLHLAVPQAPTNMLVDNIRKTGAFLATFGGGVRPAFDRLGDVLNTH